MEIQPRNNRNNVVSIATSQTMFPVSLLDASKNKNSLKTRSREEKDVRGIKPWCHALHWLIKLDSCRKQTGQDNGQANPIVGPGMRCFLAWWARVDGPHFFSHCCMWLLQARWEGIDGRPTSKRASLAAMIIRNQLYLLLSAIILCESIEAFAPSILPPPPRVTTTTCLHARKKRKKKKAPEGTVAVNRVAYRNYEVVDSMEAGISLVGTEVKSIRDGKINLRDGYIRPTKNGRSCVLYNVHIGKHKQCGEYYQHEERRPRTLLVHKEQARKLLQQVDVKGMTIIPLKAYFNKANKLKLEIALCRGKNVRDKRADIKERDARREERRIIKSFRIG